MNSSKYLVAIAFLFSLNSSALEFLSAFNDENGAKFVQIKRDALGKEFLVHRYVKPLVDEQTHASSAAGLNQDLIVHFVSSGNAVHMLGSTEDITVDSVLKSKMLLSEFPIVRQDADSIVFDFNKGMRKHFSTMAFHIGSSHVANISQSYVSRIETKKSGLHITQVVQYERSEGLENAAPKQVQVETPRTFRFEKGASFGEIQYLIYPYEVNPSFVPSDSKGHDNAFFNTVNVKREATSGQLSKLNLKWDLTKGPIRFYISANMPEQFREAAKEGVLYWNLAFGREVLAVDDAPLGVVAPSMEMNMVQWVNSDAATTAYGDYAHDPRTGEIKRAQVFITSGNLRFHEVKLRGLYRALQPLSTLHFGWLNTTAQFALERVAFASIPNPYRLDQLLKDAVRHLVAHEVGHTLGLRHNFLGSVAGTLTETSKNALFSRYMFGASPSIFDGVTVTTSLMEYMPYDVGVMVGAQIKNALTSASGRALRFDETAIRRLYLGVKDEAEFAFKCTDEEVGQYIDCKRHDFAADIIASQHSALDISIKRLPVTLVESFIEPLLEHGLELLPRISLSAAPIAQSELARFSEMLAPLSESTRMKSVEALFGHSGDTKRKLIKDIKRAMIRKSVQRLGGVEKAFFFLLPPNRNSTEAIEHAESMVDAHLDANFQGFGAGGAPYYLSLSELEIIKGEIKAFLPLFEESLLKETLKTLSEVDVSDPQIGLGFEDGILSVVQEIVLSVTHDGVIASPSPTDPNTHLHFRQYAYDLETRLLAIRLLFAKVANGIDWSLSTRKGLAGSLMSVANLDASAFRKHPHFVEIRKRIFEAGQMVKALSQ